MSHSAGVTMIESGGALQAQGRALLTAFHAALQSLKIYPLENATVQNSLDELHRLAERIVEQEGQVDLNLAGDFLFLNDVRLRLDLTNYVAVSSIVNALTRHGIGSIEVDAGVTRDDWAPFLSLLLRARPAAEEDVFARFVDQIQESAIEHIRITPERRGAGTEEGDGQDREAAKRTYVQTVQVAHEVLTDVRMGRAVNVRRVKRAVQSIVDQVLTNETSMVGMTTLRDYDEYTFTHSVNVCIFGVMLGQRLGFSKLQLYELGLGALLHDIGKMRIDPEVTKKPAKLNDEEWKIMQQHPTEGLLALYSMHGFGEVPFRSMLVAYEHHMKFDLTGYPRNRRPRKPTLFSRIVAVADGFDAATSKRSYQSLPLTPDQVLQEMRDNPGRGFDPLIVKAMINVTGIFPVGTLMVLDTYELAVAVAPNPESRSMNQPLVKIISDPMGNWHAEPKLVNLADPDPATGRPRRAVLKTVEAEKYGVNIADYFV